MKLGKAGSAEGLGAFATLGASVREKGAADETPGRIDEIHQAFE